MVHAIGECGEKLSIAGRLVVVRHVLRALKENQRNAETVSKMKRVI